MRERKRGSRRVRRKDDRGGREEARIKEHLRFWLEIITLVRGEHRVSWTRIGTLLALFSLFLLTISSAKLSSRRFFLPASSWPARVPRAYELWLAVCLASRSLRNEEGK